MKYHIVLTTINDPKVLFEYADNIQNFNHENETKIWVVADRKTPVSCETTCATVSQAGVACEFVSLQGTRNLGKEIP